MAASKTSLQVNVVWAGGALFGAAGQAVTLDYFLATLPSNVGPYFVLLFCSSVFTVFFGVTTLLLTAGDRVGRKSWGYALSPRGHLKLVCIGFFDSLNGFMVVFASLPWHVPATYQPLLLQAMIPLNLVFTRVVLRNRTYNAVQLLGAALVVAGLVVSLVPDLQGHTPDFESGWWWILVITGSCVPGVLMNILEEAIFDDLPSMSVSLILFLESFWQLAFMLGLFWLDILPKFGFHGRDPPAHAPQYDGSIAAWEDGVRSGFRCMFAPSLLAEGAGPQCSRCAPFGFLFSFTYICSYVFGSLLFRDASANFNAVVQSIGNPLATCYWFVFPAGYHYVTGRPLRFSTLHWTLGSLPIIFVGAYLFRRFEVVPDKFAVERDGGRKHGLAAINSPPDGRTRHNGRGRSGAERETDPLLFEPA